MEDNQIYYNKIRKEFIDRIPIIQKLSIDAHLKSFMELIQDDAVITELKKAPIADVAPVIHAKWEIVCINLRKCSNCNLSRNTDLESTWNYCPRCGAKMNLEE